MAIKIMEKRTIIDKDNKYPYFGIWDDKVVFFTDVNTGVVIQEAIGAYTDRVGKYSSSLVERNYKPFYGTIEVTK